MPELAEVEFFRKQWDSGLKQKVLSVALHPHARVLRGTDDRLLTKVLTGATLLESWAHAKQMLFHFSGGGWLGVHLGMTGKLYPAAADFSPARHDHLVLHQAKQSLVFNDHRQFGRILFHHGDTAPEWWTSLPPALVSPAFTTARMHAFLQRRGRSPLKAVLLMQEGFPGVGNWMADEILWRARVHPRRHAGKLSEAETKLLWKQVRFVCSSALRIIGPDFSDPPKTWLYLHRWEKGGDCPRCGTGLQHATIGGRTTCWCPACQPK